MIFLSVTVTGTARNLVEKFTKIFLTRTYRKIYRIYFKTKLKQRALFTLRKTKLFLLYGTFTNEKFRITPVQKPYHLIRNN